MKNGKSRYDGDYKRQGVAWIKTQQRSFQQLRCDMGVSERSLSRWYGKYAQRAAASGGMKAEIAQLRRTLGIVNPYRGGVAVPGAEVDHYSRRVGDLPAVPLVTEALEGVVHVWSAPESCTTSAAATGRPWQSSDAYWNAAVP
jgi:transposase-like protein